MIAAFDALSRMNNNTYDGVTYSVEPSKNLLRQMEEMNLGVGPNAGLNRGHGYGNHQADGKMSLSNPLQQHQQSVYGKSSYPQGRVEPPYRPQQGREDHHQVSKLYQPSHMTHHQQPQHALQMQVPSQYSRYDQGAVQAGNSYPGAASRYGTSGPSGIQGYNATPAHLQQQAHFEPHAHRYAPQHAPYSTGIQPQQQPQQQAYLRQPEHTHGGMSLASGLGNEDLYAHPRTYSQSSETQASAHGSQGSSPRVVNTSLTASSGGHARNSSRDLDFAPAVLAPVDEYVSSYLIEKPAIDDSFFDAPSNAMPETIADSLRPSMLNIGGPARNISSGLQSGLSGSGSNAARSPYSYGPNGSPHAFGEKYSSPTDLPLQQQHGAMASGNAGAYNDRRGLSSNSNSFYSNLPAGAARPPHAQSQTQQPQHPHAPQQQQSRRPVNVTDLDIGRSRSMSSAGLPTYSTNATTDCGGGFFASANSSFNEGVSPRFAHLNSFGDHHHQQQHGNTLLPHNTDSTWTGISDQKSLLTREALRNQPVRQHHPLTSSMRKLSMQSVTTNGGEDVNDLVEDDYTFAAALATTHETAGSQESLFNYTDSNASSFTLSSPAYGSSYANSANGLSFSLKEGCASENGYRLGQGHQQQHGSEVDELAQEAKQLSLAHVGSSNSSVKSTTSDEKKPSPKTRQLAVTHFFKPVNAV